jgi:hypothetical protein
MKSRPEHRRHFSFEAGEPEPGITAPDLIGDRP